MTAKCCVCEADVKIADDVMIGELINCPDCGTELEVISTSPVTLQNAPEVQEDWGE